jgi:hypothetical protein
MRLWTIHPRYLDVKGLSALWREALLAQKVLQKKTKGYRNHPQLNRFKSFARPEAAIASYLAAVLDEAKERGYNFDGRKIAKQRTRGFIKETKGQLSYEWQHLGRKLYKRDRKKMIKNKSVGFPECHPLFRIIPGDVRDWEKVK